MNCLFDLFIRQVMYCKPDNLSQTFINGMDRGYLIMQIMIYFTLKYLCLHKCMSSKYVKKH